jgi:hypothetical protein
MFQMAGISTIDFGTASRDENRFAFPETCCLWPFLDDAELSEPGGLLPLDPSFDES